MFTFVYFYSVGVNSKRKEFLYEILGFASKLRWSGAKGQFSRQNRRIEPILEWHLFQGKQT